MAGVRKRSNWLLKVYGSAVGICIVVGFLSGPTMPEQTALIARLVLACLMTPFAFLIPYSIYHRILFRRNIRRWFDGLARMPDQIRFEIVDPRDAAKHCPAAVNAIARRAAACNALHLGDVREHFTADQAGLLAHLRIMTLDDARMLMTIGHVRYAAPHRLYLWLAGRSDECNSIDLYSHLSNGRIVRTSDGVLNWIFSWEGDQHVRQRGCFEGQTLAEMIQLHRGDLAAELTVNPVVKLTRFTRIEDAVAAGQRMVHLMDQAVRRQGIFSDQRADAYCRRLTRSRARVFREELHAARKRFGCQPTAANTNTSATG